MASIFRASRSQFPAGNASGKWIVAAMVGVAILSAGVTIAYHWSHSRFAVGYWGSENATRIRAGTSVRLIDLAGNGTSQEISHVKGLVHLRQALIENSSFVGKVAVSKAAPLWQVELIFAEPIGKEQTYVQFDLERGLVGLPDKAVVLDAAPIAEGLRTFFADLGVDVDATSASQP